MILVTGGTGLVGSHLLLSLVQKGNRVRAIKRITSDLSEVKKIFGYYTDNAIELFELIDWVDACLTNIVDLEKAFEDISHVYHCAAIISFDERNFDRMHKVNIEGTANIVNLCIENEIKKLCYISSIASLGESINNQPITEETPWNPEKQHSCYAITKRGADMEVWRATQEGLDVIILHPSVILGPGFWNKTTGQMIRRVQQGLQYYPKGSVGYVSVNDVIHIAQQLMNSDHKNEHYITSSENLTYQEILSMFADILGKKAPSRTLSYSLLSLGQKVNWATSRITGREQKLTKTLIKTANKKLDFDNTKLTKTLNYQFEPINNVVKKIADIYSKEQKIT